MNKPDRYGEMCRDYLRARHPRLLEKTERNDMLFEHLLAAQRSIEWEMGQLIAAGVEEDAAKRYVIEEYLRNPELA